MAGRYWDTEPTARSAPRTVRMELPDRAIELHTDRGVFAASGIDHGTQVLLRHVEPPRPHTGIVDVGTGYGPIAAATAIRQPAAGIWAVDVNRRALRLARINTAALDNVIVAEPGEVPETLRFDGLLSNPPIKVGKNDLQQLLMTWFGRLVPGSSGWLVVKKAMGADSLQNWLNEAGFPTVRASSKRGYRVLHTTLPGSTPPVDTADLAEIARATGGRWTVLGRLAGGFSDPAVLVRRGEVRAVLKIKSGDWWTAQLARLVPVSEQLRTAGYPTPEIIAAGPLPEERAYVMTAWVRGTPNASPTRRLLESALASADLHREVHPSPERDWSAMITLFLNGGITHHRFHPDLAPLARQALQLVPKPVPALPTGNFVHGDFNFGNLLVDDGEIAAVVDIEGFGTGTVAIDLVALLTTLPNTDDCRLVIDRVVELCGQEVAAACLAHRVLAILEWASLHPGLRETAIACSTRLLALAPYLFRRTGEPALSVRMLGPNRRGLPFLLRLRRRRVPGADCVLHLVELSFDALQILGVGLKYQVFAPRSRIA